MSKEAMTLALEALETGEVLCEVTAANILREALAQPAQQPLTGLVVCEHKDQLTGASIPNPFTFGSAPQPVQQPLSWSQRQSAFESTGLPEDMRMAFGSGVLDAEQIHGIKGKP